MNRFLKKKNLLSAIAVTLIVSAVAYAGGYQNIGNTATVLGNNADGSAPNPTLLFKTERNGTTAISVAPYSALGTVGQVNSPNGTTPVNALLQVVGFPLCPETSTASACTAALQRVRVPTVTNMSVPVAGLITAVQTHGWNGIYISSVNFGGASISSADATMSVSVRQMPPQGVVPETNLN